MPPLHKCTGADASLLAPAVDQPLDADMGAALRHLCRRLCALRAACGEGDAPGAAAAATQLNVLLAVAGEYFGAARALYQ
jgi:hypothetical protein